MGEVYRATDTRLDRSVAIKVLPAAFSANAQLKIRFEREAKAISGLAHPHICTLYDIGHENGMDYLVLELLEGESLADRLLRGPLPVEQTLRYGAQIAEALDRAHRSGIVHRDLKPGNVMITKSGAKLLDFGLARPGVQPISASDATAALATEHKPLTEEGTIVGTFQYMSPEQIEGRAVDTRSDIFSLGAVLYEMSTGRRAFEGKSRASLIASILDREPEPISNVQPMTPCAFERLVQICLRKDPDERWQSAHDIAAELKWIAESGSSAGLAPAVAQKRKRKEIAWIAAAAIFALATIALAFTLFTRKPQVLRELRAQIAPPPHTTLSLSQVDSGAVTISPDGHWVTFATIDEKGTYQLWLRATDSLDARPLPGGENASYPFWSPDSRSIAFFAQEKLKRLDLDAGTLTSIADVYEPRGGAWGPDGTILFTPFWRAPLMRIPANGGKPQPATTLDASQSETTHRFPCFLPDGEHYLYFAGSHLAEIDSDKNAIYVASLKTKERKLLLHARSNVVYTSGQLLFVRDNVLLAQPFDVKKLTVSGEPRRIAEGVFYEPTYYRGAFAAADDGTLVYAPGSRSSLRRLAMLDRTGKQTEVAGDTAYITSVRFSVDGTKAALTIGDLADIWVADLQRGVRQRLTNTPMNDYGPIWSPDGRSIVYSSDRNLQSDIFMRAADGSGGDIQLLNTPSMNELPSDWSRDGRFLLFDSAPNRIGGDIWVLPMTGTDRKPRPFVNTKADEWGGTFSPDGKWVSFVSNESGLDQIYVAPFDGSGAKQQVSTSGCATAAGWRKDGRELSYVARDGTITAVKVTPTPTGMEIAQEELLFKLDREVPIDAAPDLTRFLIARTENAPAVPLALVTGWAKPR
jgi:serine/threonine protein kinase